jgi:Zn-dependent peptidase ImmA (M78 family)
MIRYLGMSGCLEQARLDGVNDLKYVQVVEGRRSMQQVSRRDFIMAVTRAEDLLRDLKMSREMRPDPVRVCELAGIKVHVTDDVQSPLSFVANGRPTIWLPRHKCQRARDFHFDLAHELHHCLERARCDDTELSANVFAGTLLLPAEHLEAEWDEHRDLRHLEKTWWNVPPTCLVLRLGELEVAHTWVYQRATLRYARAGRALAANEVDEALETLTQKRAHSVRGVRASRLPDGPHRLAFVSAA